MAVKTGARYRNITFWVGCDAQGLTRIYFEIFICSFVIGFKILRDWIDFDPLDWGLAKCNSYSVLETWLIFEKPVWACQNWEIYSFIDTDSIVFDVEAWKLICDPQLCTYVARRASVVMTYVDDRTEMKAFWNDRQLKILFVRWHYKCSRSGKTSRNLLYTAELVKKVLSWATASKLVLEAYLAACLAIVDILGLDAQKMYILVAPWNWYIVARLVLGSE